MPKRGYVSIALIIFTLLMVLEIQSINPVRSQYIETEISPPKGINAYVEIYSPENYTFTSVNHILLNVTAGIGQSNVSYDRLSFSVAYQTDWRTNATILYSENFPYHYKNSASSIVTFSNLTEGNHTLVCYVNIFGQMTTPAVYPIAGLVQRFTFTNSSLVSFVVDTVAPLITNVSLANQTFVSSNVTSSFKVSEPVVKLSYSLDNQGNVSFNGGQLNFIDLSNGRHNVTIFAVDSAGNIGKSELLQFYVKLPAPFPTPVIIAIVVTIVMVGSIVLLYKRHRKTSSLKS